MSNAFNNATKLANIVSVTDFGAACDGITDDWAAILAAQQYLQTVGGGTLFFPGFCKITATFHLYGSITGGWGQLYPEPNEKKITWTSNGAGGIISTVASGDVIRLSKDAVNTLEYKVGFKDFVINCAVNNVVAINGYAQGGITGDNHHLEIDNLLIHGIEGVNAIGIDFGTITDSQVRGLKVQGWGTGPYAGVRIEKADVQLVNCMFVYCRNSVVIGGQLTEACVQAVGCQFLNPKSYHVFWEATSPDYKASASIISASFVGECTHAGSAILGAATPATLDVGAFTFEGCTFDNYRSGAPLMDITWGGRFTFIGNAFYDAGAGGLGTVKFGTNCDVVWLNNTALTIDPASDAYASGKINRFANGLVSSTGIAVGGAAQQTSGITFPVTAVAVANVNTLDDYEEGTWTPALTFSTPGNLSVAYTRTAGRYQKIGNTVYCSFTIVTSTFTHTTASGELRITELPFATSSDSDNFSSVGCAFEGWTKANYTQSCIEPTPGQSYATFLLYGSGQAAAVVSSGDVPTGTRKLIQGQFQYKV
jgi:hypothetical protein